MSHLYLSSVHALNKNDAARRGWSDHAIDELHRNDKEISGTFLVNGLQVSDCFVSHMKNIKSIKIMNEIV